jgi:hypothetical protein
LKEEHDDDDDDGKDDKHMENIRRGCDETEYVDQF